MGEPLRKKAEGAQWITLLDTTLRFQSESPQSASWWGPGSTQVANRTRAGKFAAACNAEPRAYPMQLKALAKSSFTKTLRQELFWRSSQARTVCTAFLGACFDPRHQLARAKKRCEHHPGPEP